MPAETTSATKRRADALRRSEAEGSSPSEVLIVEQPERWEQHLAQTIGRPVLAHAISVRLTITCHVAHEIGKCNGLWMLIFCCAAHGGSGGTHSQGGMQIMRSSGASAQRAALQQHAAGMLLGICVNGGRRLTRPSSTAFRWVYHQAPTLCCDIGMLSTHTDGRLHCKCEGHLHGNIRTLIACQQTRRRHFPAGHVGLCVH